MKSEIKIPSMGESISTVIIGTIFTPTGTVLQADSEILEVETDKVNQPLYAPCKGELTLTVQTGDTVAIGAVIGFIDSQGEEKKEEQRKEEDKIKKESTKFANNHFSSTFSSKQGEMGIRKDKADFLNELQEKRELKEQKQPETIFKEELKCDPEVKGQEIDSNLKQRETRRPLSTIRKVIANRLVQSQQTTAMLTTFNEVDLTEIVQTREKYQEAFSKKHGVKLGFMSFFVKAVTAALKIYPVFNSYLDGEEIVSRRYYDLGIAVGTEKGVIVPVVRGCDTLSFSAIESQIFNYAKSAKEGSLKADDLQGAGFTITNGGVYGSLLSTPILAPMQTGILGMHKIEKRAVVVKEQIVICPMMYLALSYDHRLADGKEAVSFLVHIKQQLEQPSRLLLEI